MLPLSYLQGEIQMKALFALLAFSALSAPAFATVDGHTRAYIVVQHVQDDTEFFLERVPVIGCYGLARGPQLAQFTAEYHATSNIGCGGPTMHENINALSCAQVTASEETADYESFKSITLDISKCAAKGKPKFITMVRTAAKLNFPQKKGQVALTLIK